jgi:hypothetical protein
MKNNIIIIFILVSSIFFVSCISQNELAIEESEAVVSDITKPVPPKAIDIIDMSDKRASRLTGHYIDYNIANQRPIAVVINNINVALPQSGIKQADIFYEVLSEGDITRIIAIFEYYNHDKIGPIRSARDYFLHFAIDHDALFIHHGGSVLAYSAINTLNVDNLDGMNDTANFFRDQQRVNTRGMYEHSSFINGENLNQHFKDRGVRTERFEDDTTGFKFFPVVSSPVASGNANKITIPFSSTYTSVFKYNEDSKLYYKYRGDTPHIDGQNNYQITVTNVIVQNVNMRLIPGDEAGRREVDLVGRGDGYLFTNGTYSHITWHKESNTTQTRWFDEQGAELMLNKGKTWIAIHDGEVMFEYYKDIPTIDHEVYEEDNN